jgi:hypothetical protein
MVLSQNQPHRKDHRRKNREEAPRGPEGPDRDCTVTAIARGVSIPLGRLNPQNGVCWRIEAGRRNVQSPVGADAGCTIVASDPDSAAPMCQG